MNYTATAIVGTVLAVGYDLALARTSLLRRRAFWAAYAVILVFQVISDGILTGLPVVRYDPSRVLGLRLANAPVEDLLFGFALVLTTLSTWVWVGRPARGGPPPSPARRPAPGDRSPPRPGG